MSPIDVPQKLAAYMMSANYGFMAVKPLDVPCRYCKAEPGETCTRWRRGKPSGNKYRAPRSPHPDRVYDAECASNAVRALSFDAPLSAVLSQVEGRLQRAGRPVPMRKWSPL